MKVKILKPCWYQNTLYDPDTSVSDIYVEYACKDIKELPSWAEAAESEKPAPLKKEKTGDKSNGIKVSELPVTEKNALLEKAKAAGIEGNQILSWKVETLKAKIEAGKKDE